MRLFFKILFFILTLILSAGEVRSTAFDQGVQPYKFGDKELDEMHGLNWYDQGARLFGSILPVTSTPDPMAEKYYSMSPYCQMGNNPVRYVDPDGRDWYWDRDKIRQFNPDLNENNLAEILQEGQTYIGETDAVKHKNGSVIEDYRSDGSIIYSNETSAYNRMRSQATAKNIEESGYALENDKFIVMPDYKNEVNEVDISDYDYSVNKNGILSNEAGEKFKITGNIHTHQNIHGDPDPSFWTGTGWGDVGHSKAMGGLPIITIGHDGRIHGAFWSVTDNGFRRISGFGTRKDLLSGKTQLIPWLKTYPTRGK